MTGERYDETVRWTMLLQEKLGGDYKIIEEGLNGRTTVLDDPLEPGRNGFTYLGPCVQSQSPLDLVVLMLGTNDLKRRFNLAPEEIAMGLEKLVLTITGSGSGRNGNGPRILVLSPPLIGRIPLWEYSFRGAEEKSEHLAVAYREVSERNHCAFLNIGGRVKAGGEDGVHLTVEDHRIIAGLVAKAISDLEE